MSSKIEEIKRQLEEGTRSRRPTMELALETTIDAMSRLPSGVVAQLQGPELWTWKDRNGKVYALAPSPDHDGYPMLTIRQPIAEPLGAWLTTTNLLLGPDRAGIMNSITMMVVAHMGANSGYEATVRETARGGVKAGIDKACTIVGRDPAVNSAIAKAIMDEGKDRGPGDLN